MRQTAVQNNLLFQPQKPHPNSALPPKADHHNPKALQSCNPLREVNVISLGRIKPGECVRASASASVKCAFLSLTG